VFDEYDAGRPDVMFVIQRVLEASGKLTLLDQNRIISPHPFFRLFATSNTIGSATRAACITARSRSTRADGPLVDRHHAQLPRSRRRSGDRAGQGTRVRHDRRRRTIMAMVRVADMTRNGFMNGDISTVMSRARSSPGPRTHRSSATSGSRSA